MTTGLARAEDGIPIVANQGARDARFPIPAVDQRVQNTGTGFFERWTGTLWAQETPIFALGQSDAFPVVANAAARDARYPTPAANQRVQRTDTGYVERFDTILVRWLPESLTRAGGPVGTPRAKGGYGDGVNDDTTYVQATDADHAISGQAELDPGTYLLNFNGTINLVAHWKPKRGSIFKLGPNTVLNFAFPPDAGDYQFIDDSAATPTGGYATISGKTILPLNPMWWGLKGDGVNDDDVPNQSCWNACPDRGHIVYRLGMQMKHKYLAILGYATGITLEAQGFPGDAYFNDNSPSFIEDPAGPLVGRSLIMTLNCGYVTWRGLHFQSSGVGLDVDGASVTSTIGDKHLVIGAPGYFVEGTGVAIFDLLRPGTIIAAGGVVSTLGAVADATHAQMAANAVVTGLGGNNNGTSILVGRGARTRQPRPPTQSVRDRCRFTGKAGAKGWVGCRVSWKTGFQCDFNFSIDNVYAGNGQFVQQYPLYQTGGVFAQAVFNASNDHGGVPGVGWTSPGGVIVAGTNIFAVTNDTFPVQMEGDRYRGEAMGGVNLGPNGTRGSLDAKYTHVINSKSISFWTDATMTVPVNSQANIGVAYNGATAYAKGDTVRSGGIIYEAIQATTGNAPPNATFWKIGHEPTFRIGEALGTGFLIGPSQNCHHNKEFRPQYLACGIGLSMLAGSFTAWDAWSSGCSVALAINAASSAQLPCHTFNWNSENDEQHLFLLTGTPFSEANGRHYMSWVTPSDGYYRIIGTGSSRYRLQETRIEGKIPFGSSVFNLPGAVNVTIRLEGVQFFDAYSTTEVGVAVTTPWANGVVIYFKDCEFDNPDGVTLPLDARETFFTSDTSWSNGLPVVRLGNTVYIRMTDTAPAQSKFRNGEMTFIMPNDAGNRNPAVVSQWTDGTYHIQKIGPRPFDLVDGANIPIDMAKGDVARIISGQAAPTFGVPANPIEGQPLTLMMYATNAAGLTPGFAFSPLWKWAGAAPAFTIAQNKAREIRWRYWAGSYWEEYRSPADIA